MIPRQGRRSSTFESIRTSARRVSAKILNPLRSTSASRARLSRELLLYWLGIVAIIILAPLRFVDPPGAYVIARVLLFVPLGFLFPLTLQGRNPKPLPVALLGLLLGGALAAIPPYDADPVTIAVDVIASALGAGVGAYLLQAANRRIASSGRLAGRLSLEIPLVALIYMLLPALLTTSLLAALDSPTAWLRSVALVPLGLLGARLIAAVHEYHFAPAGVLRRRSVVAVAAGWMILGVFPVMLQEPAVGLGLVGLVALTTFRATSTPVVHLGGVERRFEADTIRKSVPSLAAYFVIMTAIPLAAGFGEWSMDLGLTGSHGDAAGQLIALLAPIASLALLGYLLAEARGRRELSFRKTLPRIVAECAGVALAMEVTAGFAGDDGFSLLQFAAAIGAGVLGAGIYHSQRERLQSILIPQRAPKGPMLTNIGRAVARVTPG
jgi:hypothetical protein